MGGAALIAFIAAPSAFAQISLTSSSYTQNFNSYVGSAATVPAGWTSSASGYQGVGSTSSSTGGNYASQTGTDRGFGALRSNSTGNITLGVGFTNNTGSTITSLTLSWNYEQFKFGNTSGFDLSGTGGLAGNSILNGKDFSGVASGSGLRSTAVSSFTITGLSIANGATFGFNWVATDVSGADNGVAIDDFSLTIPASGNNTVITTTTSTVAFGRVMQGTANPTNNVTLSKSGTDTTTYTTTTIGSATVADAGTAFASGPQSDQISVGINRSTTGAKSGTVTVDNTASNSGGSDQGSADANDVISVSGTVVANRVIEADSVNLGKVLVGTTTGNQASSLTTTGVDAENTRVTVNGTAASTGGVTVAAGSSQLFNDAADTIDRNVSGNFSTSGVKNVDVNLSVTGESLTGESVNAVTVNATADVYQAASLTANNSSDIATGGTITVDNADTTDGGQRAAAEIISKTISGDEGWSVSDLDAGTVITQNGSASGTATFDTTGKLNGTHVGTLILGFQHADQTIQGTSAGDLGTRSWSMSHLVEGVSASSGSATVQGNGSYAGFGLTNSSGAGTQAGLLGGTASGEAEIVITFSAANPGAINDADRVSDVVNLTGTDNDLVVLELSYNPANILPDSSEEVLSLGWLNEGRWVLANEGNTGNTTNGDYFQYVGSFSDFQLAYGSNLSAYIGAYGVDITNNSVWAVINHNSEFSVIPEPGTFALVAAAGTFLVVFRRRQRAQA